ncbi:uncharacterized protein LOC116420968 [Sarcophilus harrisii]|uniref:uncharacterized protein LOC116420968 n=1 Tax=Sarcophilus harrisii TaxID=9305 RepID=UPI0013019CED|nr:uncharacterized protein LOC116420968 [Sarcophilus harrisii]
MPSGCSVSKLDAHTSESAALYLEEHHHSQSLPAAPARRPRRPPARTRTDSPTDTTTHVLPPPHHNTRPPVTRPPLPGPRPRTIPAVPGTGRRAADRGLRSSVGWREPSPACDSKACAARPLAPSLPSPGPGTGTRAPPAGGRAEGPGSAGPGPGPGPGAGSPARGEAAGEAGRRLGARGRPRRPGPRPGAEQREAAQAATGPAAARGPRGAARWLPRQLSRGLGGGRRHRVPPQLLTEAVKSLDPGAPGRTAEMPQTDTAAILETTILAEAARERQEEADASQDKPPP